MERAPMDHVAIMNKSWGLIPKICSGEKTIESRWYRTRRDPWNNIAEGDTVYFKNAGEPVVARAIVSHVVQFEMEGASEVQAIADQYADAICLVNRDVVTWGHLPRYCVLIFLASPHIVQPPFDINKSGFGMGSAWLTVPSIQNIKR